MIIRMPREWFRRRTSALILACGAFLAGLLLAKLDCSLPLWFVILLGLVWLPLSKRANFHLIILVLAAGSFGVWRGSVYLQQLQPYKTYMKQTVTLEVTALDDAVYAENGQLSFPAGKVVVASQPAKGQIRVKGFGELAVYRGDRLRVTGALYPTRGATQATLSYAQLQRIGGHQTWLDVFRQRFVAGVQTALPEPLASFGMGLLIGQRNTLPSDVTEALKMVGLTHIIAVSGYNMTIMLDFGKKLFAKWSKRSGLFAAFVLMAGFIAITGFSASIVRAAVVSTLSLAAWSVGRRPRPLVIIMLAAALTTAYNPVYLWSDIGWYLSFLAFFGILLLAPQIQRRLWPHRTPSALAGLVTETLSAELMTIPLIMFVFGQVSFVGLLANVLVASVIPLAMFLTFVVGCIAMIAPLYIGWIALPLRWLLTYMLDVAQLLSRVPHGFMQGTFLTRFDMVLWYTALLLLLWALYRPRRWFEQIAQISPSRKNGV